MNPLLLVAEAVASIVRDLRRIAPMAAGIVWGVASVFVLVAVTRGFETTQRQALEAMGDKFLLLRVNKPTVNRTDNNAFGFVKLEGDDIVAARDASLSVDLISPKAFDWRSRAYRDGEQTRGMVVGVWPEYRDIVHVPLAPGSRWLDDNDIANELPVTVIGPRVRKDLFGDGPYLGRQMSVGFRNMAGDPIMRKLTVIGALEEEELASDSVYLSQRSTMFVPFPLFERMSARGFMFFVMKPHEGQRDDAVAEVRAVLGDRQGFDGSDSGTLIPYFDAIERGEQIDAVFGGLQTFLVAVGALILLLGAVGVANVVLMSVTARTFEFGLRRALGCKARWIFAQVFLEAAFVCVFAGLLGFILGMGGVALMGQIDLPDGFAAPRAELGAALLPGVLLLAVSLVAAAWPAFRAARIPVVVALQGGR